MGSDLAAFLAWLVGYRFGTFGETVVIAITMPYLVMYLAFRGLRPLRKLTAPGDVSYGLYIYAWPVSQLVVEVFNTNNPWVVTIVGGVITYALALASWRLIERPALALKRRLADVSVRYTPEGRRARRGAVASASD